MELPGFTSISGRIWAFFRCCAPKSGPFLTVRRTARFPGCQDKHEPLPIRTTSHARKTGTGDGHYLQLPMSTKGAQ